MALSNINFTRTTGNINRALPGQDHISGLVFYGAKPAEFGSASAVAVYSITEAEAAGITEATYPVQHYHIKEFFRINPGAKLYVGIYAAPTGTIPTHDFAEVASLQNFAGGEIRQAGVYTQLAFASAQVTALQSVCTQLENEDQPLSAMLTADISATTLGALPDLLASNAKNVSVVIGQDGNGKGSQLFTSQAKTIGCLGAALGAVSFANVNESIAWVRKFNVGGAELDELAFGEGTLFKELTRTAIEGVDAKGYVFLQKHKGVNGSFFNASWTASNEDYNTIELNRAIDKAVRGIRAALLPFLNSPLYVNSAGQLTQDTIASIRAAVNAPVQRMQIDGELSAYVVDINPDQDVVTTSTLSLQLRAVPVGVARQINVKVGYTTSL